jgi:hypothetical protein
MSFELKPILHSYINISSVFKCIYKPVLRIQTLFIRIRILLITLIRIRILLSNLIWIRVRLYKSGSLLFQRGNVLKTVLFIHLYLIFLVSMSNRTHTKGILC